MRIFLILILVMTLLGCDIDNPEDKGLTISGKPKAEITYFRDDKTGLCFARYSSRTSHMYIVSAISNVPCEKVENFLDK
jgi:hypothetical protein